MLILRKAVPDDAQLLSDLRIQMRRERETVPLTVPEEEFRNANFEFFRKALTEMSYIGLIAQVDGEIAGTGGICLHIHPPSYQVPNGKTACLLNMYTLPAFRGRGIAGQLLEALVRIAGEMDCCKVTLNASDMGKPLYLKYGFSLVNNEMELPL